MITSLTGKYAFLSNFYPCVVEWDHRIWASAEHVFQARKTISVWDQSPIRHAKTAAEAKRWGQRVPLRRDWERAKKQIMFEVVLAKFTQNAGMRRKLLVTGQETIVEGNDWGDQFWGVTSDVSRILPCWWPEKCLYGHNYLGKTLMYVRDLLRED